MDPRGRVSGTRCNDENMHQIRAITIDLGERERKAAAAGRRFPCTISSETPVPRRSWTGEVWNEVLSHARGAVDLSRSPLPVIEGHDRTKTNVGMVEGLKLDGTRLRGELVLGASARAAELAADIAEGIVRNLSVGYSIDTEERDEKAKRITARKWTPYEVSIVSVPADVTVGINRGARMDPQNPVTPQTPAPDEATRAAVELATRTERERGAEIRALVRQSHLGDALAEDLVTRGATLEQARALVIERLAFRDEQIPTRSHLGIDAALGRSPITPGDDLAEDFHRAAIDALLLRSGIPVAKPHAAAGDVSASVHDLARTCLSRAGKSASRLFGGEARGPKLLERAMTTSDFPLILAGALHASVRQGYETEPSSHRAWVRTAPVVDFRDQERPILGSAPELNKVLEHGEYKDGDLTEDSTKYRVEKYGVIVSLTWEVLKNDNLGAFLRVQPALGQAARRKEADVVYDLLAENSSTGPTMQDGEVLFHTATHKNLTSSGAFDAALLGAGRALLRKQTAVGGGYLSLVPSFLIVPAERETTAEILLANASRRVTAEKATAEWIASLELVVEPRLANTGVYLAAAPGQIDTVELGLLEDNAAGPVIDEEQEFRIDAKRWKVRHVFGAKPLDWRGLVRMPVSP